MMINHQIKPIDMGIFNVCGGIIFIYMLKHFNQSDRNILKMALLFLLVENDGPYLSITN